MDKLIKEGTLRKLISESICDVILSCKDNRLMAHRLILSIASPIFRELLNKNSNDSTSVIILPDISGSTMSTILDYVYTGTTVIYSNSLQEFLSVAKFLQISVDKRSIENVLENLQNVDVAKKLEAESDSLRFKEIAHLAREKIPKENIDYCKVNEEKQDMYSTSDTKEVLQNCNLERECLFPNILRAEPTFSQTKPQKRLPDLLPINDVAFRKNVQKRMCNAVVPSPWCQRGNKTFLGDPRLVSLTSSDREIKKGYVEDTNNNFQPTQNTETSNYSPTCLDRNIRHLFENNSSTDKETSIDKSTKINSIAGEDYTKRDNFVSIFSKNYYRNTSKTLEVPEKINTLFSPSFLKFKQCEIRNREERTDSRLCFSEKNDTVNTEIIDYRTQYSLRVDCASENPKNNELSLTENVPNLIKTLSVTSAHSPLIPFTKDNLIGKIEKSTESNAVAPSLKTSNKTIIDDVSHDNHDDNSISSDSYNHGKIEAETHGKKNAYECEDCGKTFSQLRNYKYHRSIHKGTKEFSAECPECGKIFNDRGYLSSHMKIHRDRKEYACPNCPKRFNQRVAYNMHFRIHTGVKPHECPTCGKSFSRKMLLKQHQRVHTGERPYSCPECGKSFADRSNMSLHARLHTGVKPYACSLCPKSFTKKHHLKTHMNFHTGLKPYTCENCGLAFSQSSNMRTHYKKCILKESFGKIGAKIELSAENS